MAVVSNPPRSPVLTCSCVEDATKSLSQLFEMSVTDLTEALQQCEINWDHPTIPSEDQIGQHLGYPEHHQLPAPTAIRWFHATRTPSGAALGFKNPRQSHIPSPDAFLPIQTGLRGRMRLTPGH